MSSGVLCHLNLEAPSLPLVSNRS